MTLYSAETPLEGKLDTDMPEVAEADEWLEMARDAFTNSSEYFDSSIRRRQENAQAHFNNRHVPGSKYYSDLYKTRAQGFRPKSRSVVRRNEAAAVKAFFSTQEVVHIAPEDPADAAQKASAEIMNELINYRLSNTIKWLPLLVGAYQDTLVAGVCISRQTWDYQQVKMGDEPLFDHETGEPVIDELGNEATNPTYAVVNDAPNLELRPIENVLFSSAADWTDPVGSSPFIIDKMPMYIGDVKIKIDSGEWLEISDSLLQAGTEEYYDSIRSEREGQREDSKDQTYVTHEFDTVWVHWNIIRKEGRDYCYYTLGIHAMLTEPELLTEKYIHLREGQRPYVMGSSIIETHKTYPSSLTTLTESLQQEANDISNQRRDNVSLVLNKRYYVRRGSGVDFRSLTKNIPGSVTVMGDIQNDVRTESPPEVTGSSYQEQDRVNMDYDELAGSFSSSSVGSSRQLNETVGGMSIMQGDANEMMEYQLRVFAETWVEPVIKQLIQLEQAYETDQAVLNVAGRNASAMQKYGLDQITDQMLQGTMTVEVNVGFGATSPQKRIESLTMGLRSVAEFIPDIVQGIDRKEIVTEVMGALGFKGAERFFPKLGEEQPDPQLQQMQQQIQQLTQQLQSQTHMKEADHKRAVEVEQIRAQAAVQVEQMRVHAKMQDSQTKAQVESTKVQLKHQIDQVTKQIESAKSEIERGKLINARDALLWQMELEGANYKQGMQQAAAPMANPTNDQGIVISNDQYQSVPGQRG